MACMGHLADIYRHSIYRYFDAGGAESANLVEDGRMIPQLADIAHCSELWAVSCQNVAKDYDMTQCLFTCRTRSRCTDDCDVQGELKHGMSINCICLAASS